MDNENVNTNIGQPEEKTSGLGGIIGVIIIIIVLIAGGWYFIGGRVNKIQEQNEASKVLDVSTGDSTEVADIQADLDGLDLDVLDLQ